MMTASIASAIGATNGAQVDVWPEGRTKISKRARRYRLGMILCLLFMSPVLVPVAQAGTTASIPICWQDAESYTYCASPMDAANEHLANAAAALAAAGFPYTFTLDRISIIGGAPSYLGVVGTRSDGFTFSDTLAGVCPSGLVSDPASGLDCISGNQENPQKDKAPPEGKPCKPCDSSSPNTPPQDPPCDAEIGNPCNAANGNKHQVETDYVGTGPMPLVYQRTYNSISSDYNQLIKPAQYWRSTYDRSISLATITSDYIPSGSITAATVKRPNGDVYYFTLVNGQYVPDSDVNDVLTQTTTGWTYALRDGTVETYDANGRLTAITNAAGMSQNLNYDATTGYLTSVTDAFGHSLTFTYDSQGRLSTMTDPDGNQTTYGYTTDGNNNLSTVTYADGKSKTYLYNEQADTENTNLPHALTGIIDENGNRFATFGYDTSGRAILTEHAQTTNSVPQQQFTLSYDSATQTTATDAAGNRQVLTFNVNLGVNNAVGKQYEDAAGNPIGTPLTKIYDGNNNLTCHEDEAGHITTYTYNSTNQMISMTEGLGGSCSNPVSTIATRTTTYRYLSPTLNLLTLIKRPSVYSGGGYFLTTIAYNDSTHPLLPTSILQLGYTPAGVGESREVSMTYTPAGQLATLTDPDGNVTTYNYNNCTTGGSCGELASITNALTQVTTFPVYDGAGNLMEQTDPNGLSHFSYYDSRERPYLRIDNAGTGVIHTLGYTFWPSGQVGTIRDGTTGFKLTNTYDAAQELYQTTDNLSDKITDNYDPKGNLANTYTYNPDGSLATAEGWTYDAFNHVASISTPDGTTTYQNDPLGNILTVVSPDQVASGATNINTQNQYDALNRLFQTTDRIGGSTIYSYDVNDHPTSVTTPTTATSPHGTTTSYVVDDLGNVLQETSPDRGVTTYTYDNAGNLTSKTDARGIVTDYQYDALNRLTTITYPADSAENVTYTYDNCTYGKGRLCGVSDESGTSA